MPHERTQTLSMPDSSASRRSSTVALDIAVAAPPLAIAMRRRNGRSWAIAVPATSAASLSEAHLHLWAESADIYASERTAYTKPIGTIYCSADA